MTTKVKIDIANGFIEAEGSEEFVRTVYEDFKEKLASEPPARQKLPPAPTLDTVHGVERNSGGSRPKPVTSRKRAQSAAPSGTPAKKALGEPKVIKTLDLSGGPAGRLRDFYDQYEVETNFERNLIFLYFLQNKMDLEGITQDHIFTCYRDIPGIKAPAAMRQGLLDTDSRKNWIDASNPEDLKLSVHGVNHLEHDMKRKPKD